ncbi:hypothetical protein Tco_1073022 [Tanacetum coccineum]
MSSPTHPTPSDVDEECAFPSANILDYTSTLPNYFPAISGNNSSKNSKNDEIPPVVSPFYNNPYLKDMQAFYAKGSPIPPPDHITPPAILTPSPSFSIEERNVLLEAKDREIEDLKSQLLKAKEDSAEVTRLRAQVSGFEATESSLRGEVASAHDHNVVLVSIIAGKDQELSDLGASSSSLRSENQST